MARQAPGLYPIYGVQFHPESILTPRGKDMLKNFIALSKEGASGMIKEAIVKIVSKAGPDLRRGLRRHERDHERRDRQPPRTRPFWRPCPPRAPRPRRSTRSPAAAAAMRDHATKVDTGMDIVEIVGTGGDGAQMLQHLHHGGPGRRCRGRQGRQARQPGGLLPQRHGGRAWRPWA